MNDDTPTQPDDEDGTEPTATTWSGVDTASVADADGYPPGSPETSGDQSSDAQPAGSVQDDTADSTDAQSIPPAGGQLPASTARAVIAATVLGAVALSVHEPLVGAGVLAGIVFGTVVSRFTGGFLAVTAGSVVLPGAVLGLLAGFGAVAQTAPRAGLSALGVVVGLSVAALRSDVTSYELQQFGFLSLLGGLVVAVPAGVSYYTVQAGGLGILLRTVVGILPFGFDGLIGWFLVTAVAVTLAVYLLPPAVIAAPERPTNGPRRKVLLGVGTITVAALLFLVIPFLTGNSTAALPQMLLVVCTYVCCTLIVGNLIVGLSWRAVGDRTKPVFGWISSEKWQQSGQETNPIVGAIAGLHLSAWAVFLSVSATTGISEPVPSLFGLTAAVLAVAGFATITYARLGGYTSLPGPISIITAGLGGSVAVVELLRTGDEPVVVLNLATLATIATVSAAVFVYSAGQHGQTLGREVGARGTTRQPQLVWLGWHSVVGVVGVGASVALFWAAGSLSVVLSAPARAGLGAGFVALVAVTALLLWR